VQHQKHWYLNISAHFIKNMSIILKKEDKIYKKTAFCGT
jgi:hypothetical protein